MRKTLFVGIGNEFRSDDGVGVFIIELLRSKALKDTTLKDVEMIIHRGEGVDLIELWKNYRRVFIFDAVSSDSEAGEVFHFQIPEDNLPSTQFNCSTHAFNIVDVIRLAKTIGSLPEKVSVYGIQAKSFDNGKGLSSAVEQSAVNLIDRIIGELK